ncbi:MAG: DEAD/DEAH box helicase [Armatimonadetes bacterium]|nr:DEAD/DEAH box helicase [Armatimonadota bacterium]MDW8121794.1 DEAD/DEAH box helicase [Armatimonadota bacterium]
MKKFLDQPVRSSWLSFLRQLEKAEGYKGQIVKVLMIAERPSVFEDPDPPLPAALQRALQKVGIRSLYRHQSIALQEVRKGNNVAIFTPTASGKTLCYNLPVLEQLIQDPNTTALYLFPTKALAQDQLRKINELGFSELFPATYDGDTPVERRRVVRDRSRIILTNPDMLHTAILPNHNLWVPFLRNLRFVVIDELHTYRGIFGIHFAFLMRRLRRMCDFYQSQPIFICTSATLGNPKEALNNLIGLPFTIVGEDASPSPAKTVVLWNPPFLDLKAGVRAASSKEALKLLVLLVQNKVRTILFTRSRAGAELLFRYSKDIFLQSDDPDLAEKISSYRAGYLPEERRAIEKRLFEGDLLGVVATSALELGIDVGELDAAILAGYPGSVASTWQRAGRAGRKKEGLVFLVATSNPVDQHIIRNPDFLFKGAEAVSVTLKNPYIAAAHILCAAYEVPLNRDDTHWFGPLFQELVDQFEQAGWISKGERKIWLPSKRPHDQIGLRTITGQQLEIREKGLRQLIGLADRGRLYRTFHPGAIYFHGGVPYYCDGFDLDLKVVWVQRADVDYYTIPIENKETQVLETWSEKNLNQGKGYLGRLKVREQVLGFKRVRLVTDQVLSAELLDLPPEEYDTVGFWFTIDAKLVSQLDDKDFHLMGSLHASEHSLIALMPLVVSVDSDDVAGISYAPWHRDTKLPTVFVYDGYPGGVGFAEGAFDRLKELMKVTLQTIVECPCEDGCPSCVQSPRCGSENRPLDKWGAAFVLGLLLGDDIRPILRKAKISQKSRSVGRLRAP